LSEDRSGAEEKTFEQLLEELEAMTRRMAAGDIGIEAAAELYERAGELHAEATERLARVQERIERLASESGAAPQSAAGEGGESGTSDDVDRSRGAGERSSGG
jgi:exodeoxyribonuclease VII small subunit